ncbi:MAG: periplasmic heavy metal sensor [Polyangiaceae bacterium]|nr:periplasmic heavy metal sensor [Polyangiaceae bacterium]
MGQGQHPRLRSLIDERRPALVERRRAIRGARAEVREALESDPFDPDRPSRGLAVLRRETASSQAVLHESLVELARGMNAEQRRRLARLTVEDKGRSRRRPR